MLVGGVLALLVSVTGLRLWLKKRRGSVAAMMAADESAKPGSAT
jgi:uncharacterized iron-regulated membrane protein